VHAATSIDPWFLREIERIVQVETEAACWTVHTAPAALLREAKRSGVSNVRLAQLLGCSDGTLAETLSSHGIRRVFKRVDTCAAEFPATTPYLYSTFGDEDEAEPSEADKVIILGSGPNRIGQGIEFDYCCVHAAFSLSKAGYETIMVNCNPETVSTDYDTSDRLYFEPLVMENVLAIYERERPLGVIVQLGGQTPLKLARALEAAGVPILGTSPDAIDLAEDRKRFGGLLSEEGILQPQHGTASSHEEALAIAVEIGFPVVVRPSYVLGGRAMAVCWNEASLERYMRNATDVSAGRPVLLDRFLENATELDLDLLCDGKDAVVCGILEHIEEAGIHSGDSAAVLPPHSVSPELLDRMREIARRLALRLGVVGLMNVQFAVHGQDVYVIEVNPRASRTVPFIAKAVGQPLVAYAALLMMGKSLEDVGFLEEPRLQRYFVKAPVFPFNRFPGNDPLLGPEMKSTGEVMGISADFGSAFAKAWIGAGNRLPLEGAVFISVNDRDKDDAVPVARLLVDMGFRLLATAGTASRLRSEGLDVRAVKKVAEGRPHVVDHLLNGEVQLVINTPLGGESLVDDAEIRTTALRLGIPCVTTLSGAMAAALGIRSLRSDGFSARSLQSLHHEAAEHRRATSG
jgi:carbamoyl-phosphate synthase large subunit